MNEADPSGIAYQLKDRLPWLANELSLSQFAELCDTIQRLHFEGGLNRAFGYARW